MPTDISEPISIYEIQFKVNIVKSLSGVFSLDLPNNDDFFTALFNAHDAAILTFGQVFSSYAMGVLKEHDGIYIFDSHSRDEDGLCVCDGYACVIKHNTIEGVVQFTMQMSQSVGLSRECLFEVVSVDVDDVTFSTANQFHGAAYSVNDNDSDDDVMPLAYLASNRTHTALPNNQILGDHGDDSGKDRFPLAELLGHDEQNQLAEMEETLTQDENDMDLIPTIKDLLHCSESDISSDDAMPNLIDFGLRYMNDAQKYYTSDCANSSYTSQLSDSAGHSALASPCPVTARQSRKRKRIVEDWKVNVNKWLRNAVYGYRNGQGHCNIWSEVDAMRGSNEIASYVFSYLNELINQQVKYVILFSDSCGEQKRNKKILSVLWYALGTMRFRSIEHVSGHSQNEGDSMHSTIERSSRNIAVYTPNQWAQQMRSAKRKRPRYIVKKLDKTDFYNLKKAAELLRNFELDTQKDKIRWLIVKRFKLTAEQPNIVSVYYDYGENCRKLNLSQKQRTVSNVRDPSMVRLENVSLTPYPLQKDKYSDLMQLCDRNIIPHAHHSFFKELPNIE
ncbi:hypothetical protein RRG08_051736 [Elysia crispata]|uniref:Uncharacterized protein n=1 Tax=Elysia crispata TaxID=231223 RepID=A0AAE1ECY9_9GAST|nr:hypothetical protein RRG08_051736 [Elysia crispata]